MRTYYVLAHAKGGDGTHSDVVYEEVAAVVASSPRAAARAALREHGELDEPPMRELVVIPSTAIRVVAVR